MNDYWQVRRGTSGDYYVIVDPDENLLIGDRLPSSLKEADQLARCANAARVLALREAKAIMNAKMKELWGQI